MNSPVNEKKDKGRRFWLYFLPAFFLAAAALLLPAFLSSLAPVGHFRQDAGLVVVSAKDEAKKMVFPLQRNDHFTIEYTHSVDRVPVCEYWRIDESGRLVLEMFENETFGAGLGDQMGTLAIIEGRQFVKDINLETERLPLRLGSIADPVISPGRTLQAEARPGMQPARLLDAFGDGELVYIYHAQ